MSEVGNTIIVTIGIFIGSFFSYLLQFFLGRTLTVTEFGDFTALLSLSYIVGVPAAVLGTSLVKKVSELTAQLKHAELKGLFILLSKIFLLIGFIVFVVVSLLSPLIYAYLKLSSVLIVMPFALSLGVTFLSTIPLGYLQGMLRYKAFATYSAISGFVRFAMPAIFVLLHFGVFGIFVALSLNAILMYLISLLILRKNFVNTVAVNAKPYFKDILKFSMPVFYINLLMMILNNQDVLLVKNYFSAELAGYYAGVVTLGKILLFGAGTVSVLMYPQIAGLKAKGFPVKKKFGQFFSLQCLIVIAGIISFSLLPKLITYLFFGDRFSHSISYVPAFSVFIGVYVLVNFLMSFSLAMDNTKVYIYLIPVVIIQNLGIHFYHANLLQIIFWNIAAVVIALLLFLWDVYRILKREKIQLLDINNSLENV